MIKNILIIIGTISLFLTVLAIAWILFAIGYLLTKGIAVVIIISIATLVGTVIKDKFF